MKRSKRNEMNFKMNKRNLLEMWKVQKVIGWLDCLFDTMFLAFIWIQGWNIFFYIYLTMAILSSVAHNLFIKKIELKLEGEK